MENVFYDKVYGEYTVGFHIICDDTGIHETQYIYFKNPRFQSLSGTKIDSIGEIFGPFIRVDISDNLDMIIKAFLDGYCDAFLDKNGLEPIHILREDKKAAIRKETLFQLISMKRMKTSYKSTDEDNNDTIIKNDET